MNQLFTEQDYKLFRKRIGRWQENYISKLNEEYMMILSQDDLSSKKFWELESRINKDKKHPGVLMDMRRSRMISNIVILLNDNVISMDDLSDFSDTLKEAIQMLIK